MSVNLTVWVWLVFLLIFVGVELLTVGLTSIWFAAGSLVALLLAVCHAPIWLQILAFVVVSTGLLLATKPFVKKQINARTETTNADSIIGMQIRISEQVNNINQTGMAVVRGQEWTVRTNSDQEVIEAGQMAKVIEIQGVKLIVEGTKEE